MRAGEERTRASQPAGSGVEVEVSGAGVLMVRATASNNDNDAARAHNHDSNGPSHLHQLGLFSCRWIRWYVRYDAIVVVAMDWM